VQVTYSTETGPQHQTRLQSLMASHLWEHSRIDQSQWLLVTRFSLGVFA